MNNQPRSGSSNRCGCYLVILVLVAIGTFFTWAWTGVKSLLGFPTPTMYISDCHRWQEINYSMVGQYECAYGTIVGMVNGATTPSTEIYFSNDSGSFYLNDSDHYFPDLSMGDCVKARGTIYRDNWGFYMEISDLYECK